MARRKSGGVFLSAQPRCYDCITRRPNALVRGDAAGSLLISSSGRYSLSSETFSSSYFSHLGGSYWQRASFDAVIVLLSVFGMLAFLPRWQRIRVHHYVVGGLLLASVALFYLLLFKSLSHANDKLMPRLMELEQTGPR